MFVRLYGTMPSVRIIEAYYGGDVVLDFPDESSRDAAFRLCLRTVGACERAAEQDSFQIRYSRGWPGLPPAPRGRLSFEEAIGILKSVVTPENKYLQVTCSVAGGRPFRFAVLQEDGSCLTIGPGWEAPNDWYDSFWANLWATFESLEAENPELRLESVGGVRRCSQGHRMSPFLDNCQVFGNPPNGC